MQLAVKVQGEIDPGTGLPEELAEGTGVFFWKKGKILDQHGIEHDTWWLVDNGVIGADGMARTSSPPYTDVSGSGGVLQLPRVILMKIPLSIFMQFGRKLLSWLLCKPHQWRLRLLVHSLHLQ